MPIAGDAALDSPAGDGLLVAGIDLAAGRGTTAAAWLCVPPVGLPGLVAQADWRGQSDDLEAVAQSLVARPPVITAIDAPLTLPSPVASALAGVLRQPVTGANPYTRAAERDPFWATLGVRPLPVSFLGGLTFRAIMLAARLRVCLPGAQIIEVFPTATLRLLEQPPLGSALPARKVAGAKTTPARRQATHAILAQHISGMAPFDPDLHQADRLDALAAALTAAYALRGQTMLVGTAQEGGIVIPVIRIAG